MKDMHKAGIDREGITSSPSRTGPEGLVANFVATLLVKQLGGVKEVVG